MRSAAPTNAWEQPEGIPLAACFARRSSQCSRPGGSAALIGVLDDTLVYYIIGDNGASAEGTLRGCFNEMTTLNGMPAIETTES
ncbi:MAG: hypothetical protein SFX73_39295 [Kofleriaceae bacterium]|nr:hypothetical protein [Kofleriaceae bacterium]